MENQDENNKSNQVSISALSTSGEKWVSRVSGGVVSATVTILFIVIPVVNTWLANTKEIQLQQIKVATEQVDYITKRMHDSDAERDLYKSEMLSCQKELRELRNSILP